jgi:hypothetical protein
MEFKTGNVTTNDKLRYISGFIQMQHCKINLCPIGFGTK